MRQPVLQIGYPPAARIRQLREAADMSREYLARHLGISAKSVELYERGRRNMSDVITCIRFARVVGVSLHSLLDGFDGAPVTADTARDA